MDDATGLSKVKGNATDESIDAEGVMVTVADDEQREILEQNKIANKKIMFLNLLEYCDVNIYNKEK